MWRGSEERNREVQGDPTCYDQEISGGGLCQSFSEEIRSSRKTLLRQV